MRSYAFGLGLFAILPLASACTSTNVCEEYTVCGDGGQGGGGGSPTTSTGGMGGGGAGGGLPDQCFPTKLTSQESIEATCGVFVRAGATGGDGSKDKPLGSLVEALTMGNVVYVCAAPDALNEAVTVNDDKLIFGGLACADWKYTAEKTKLTAPENQVPLRIQGNTSTVTFDDFEVTASNATTPGLSSIGIFIDAATVSLSRVQVTAGNGAKGKDETAPGPELAAPIGIMGTAGCTGGAGVIGGGGGGQHMCQANDVGGGPGGSGTNGTAGGQASHGQPANVASGRGGAGETNALPCDNDVTALQKQGSNGMVGEAGIGAMAADNGMLTATGYVGTSGGAGMIGTYAQGGGGGGGANACTTGLMGSGPSGGGGGAGGCGGAGGLGGGGGGGSFALISINAAVSLADVTLVSAQGGQGGTGSTGQLGQPGGDGGSPGGTGACSGGRGGNGGRGGAGGGGRGGPSVGIAFVGTAPTEAGEITITTAAVDGAPGLGGIGDNTGGVGAPGFRALRQGW